MLKKTHSLDIYTLHLCKHFLYLYVFFRKTQQTIALNVKKKTTHKEFILKIFESAQKVVHL